MMLAPPTDWMRLLCKALLHGVSLRLAARWLLVTDLQLYSCWPADHQRFRAPGVICRFTSHRPILMSATWWDLFVIFACIGAAMAVVLITIAADMLGKERLRSKGWGGAISAAVLLSCLVVGTLLAWQISSAFADPGTGFIAFVLGFASIGPLAFAATPWLLPARRRQGGPRRGGRGLAAAFFAAALLVALALVAVLALPSQFGGVVHGSDLRAMVAPLLALIAALTVAGFRVRRQRLAVSATAVSVLDPRPSVLYLREFRHERQPFVSGDADSLRPYLQLAER
ncbi:MAG: hypothetical protein LH479_03745, partial [Polaromonas sp.]|nr:hypothetical protein [Polaromonas sp.]